MKQLFLKIVNVVLEKRSRVWQENSYRECIRFLYPIFTLRLSSDMLLR